MPLLAVHKFKPTAKPVVFDIAIYMVFTGGKLWK
jgi:hypothetical protein